MILFLIILVMEEHDLVGHAQVDGLARMDLARHVDEDAVAEVHGVEEAQEKDLRAVFPTGPASCGGTCGGWADETSLDVQWAHAVAPGANIILLLAADNSFTASSDLPAS